MTASRQNQGELADKMAVIVCIIHVTWYAGVPALYLERYLLIIMMKTQQAVATLCRLWRQ